MATFTGCTLSNVLPSDTPNEGRVKINNNFADLCGAISAGLTGVTSGATIVLAGDNIDVLSGSSLGIPTYTVSLQDDIEVNSISATTFYSGTTNLNDLLGATSYNNTTPTPVTIGGIAAGSTFSGQTMQQMWDALLYPYQTPTFSAFAINGQSTTVEVGDVVPSGSTLFTWTTTNSANVSANTITIADITNAVTLGTLLADDSSESLFLPNNVTKSSADSNQWRITAVDTESNNFQRNFNVNWRWRLHYGTDPNTTLTAAGVTGLTSSALSAGFAGTYSFLAGDYKYFAYPAVMGTATTFKDTSTNLDVAMESLYTTSITNTNGVTTTYNVHRTTNILGSSIDIQIS